MSKYKITLNGKSYEIEVEALAEGEAKSASSKAPDTAVSATKAVPAVASAAKAPAAAAPSAPVSGGAGAVNAPMPGTILRVNKNVGDQVNAGEAVVVLA